MTASLEPVSVCLIVSRSGTGVDCKLVGMVVSGAGMLMKVRKVIEIEVVGLSSRIRKAREADSRSLAEICRQIPMTTMNWYRIEAEETKALPIETLRRIEEVLGMDFGVQFDN